MKRRHLLRLLGIAPLAYPTAKAIAEEAGYDGLTPAARIVKTTEPVPGRNLVTVTITTDKIAAGTITAEKRKVV